MVVGYGKSYVSRVGLVCVLKEIEQLFGDQDDDDIEEGLVDEIGIVF